MKQFFSCLKVCMILLSISCKVSVNAQTDCSCTNATTNLLINPSFESTDLSAWTVVNGTLTRWQSYVMCGSNSAYLTRNTGTSQFYQNVQNIGAGATVNVKAYLGTHTAGQSCSPIFYLKFYNASNVQVGTTISTPITTDVDVAPNLPSLYSLSGVAPSGTAYARMGASISCDYIKVDGACLTATPGAIGDTTWIDKNGNGIQETNEPGLAGVKVKLRNAANTIIDSAVTDANGKYLFTNLTPGNYSVVFPTTITGYKLSAANVGSNDAIDSDPDATTGITGTYTVIANQTITTCDGGYTPTNLSLGNRVWYDKNNDGIDAGEVGLYGIRVRLYNDANNTN